MEALAILGERDRVAELVPLIDGAIATGAVIPTYNPRLVETTAGIGAACVEDWDRAEGHFRKALELAESIPFRSGQADARRWYADMLFARGVGDDPVRAVELLGEARAIYEDIGMSRHVQLTEASLRTATPRSAPLGTSRHPS